MMLAAVVQGRLGSLRVLVCWGRGDGLCSRCLDPVLFGGCVGEIVSHGDGGGRITNEYPRRGGG